MSQVLRSCRLRTSKPEPYQRVSPDREWVGDLPRAAQYSEAMATVLWIIIGVLTLSTGFAALAALVAMSTSKYRG